MRTSKAFHETRLKIVGEALAGIKIGVLARKYGISPETIRNWVRKYRDEVGPDHIPSTDEQILELKRLQDICFLSSKITQKNRVFLPIIVMGIFYRCFISACFIL